MEKKIDSKKASLFYLIGTLFNKGIGFITVPIFTRILTVEDYGIVTTYNSWVSILMVFMSLALYMSVRLSFIDYKEKTNDFLSTILLFTMIYGSIISLIVYAVALIVPMEMSSIVVLLCMLQSLGSALIEDISQFLMMKYRYRFRTMIMVLPNLISTIVAIYIIKYIISTGLYLGRIVPTSLITFLIGLGLSIFFLLKGKIALNKEYLSFGLKVSLPLVLHGIALNILSQSDRTMITMIRNITETGIYGLIYNFSMIATVITTAFEGIWVPFFIRKMNDKRYADIDAMVTKYIELMTIAMIGMTLMGTEVVKLLATEPYWEGITIIPPIVLSNYLIFIYSLYVNVEHYYKKTIFISINTIIAAFSNIIMNYFFITWWGYVGAAYSTLISYGISLVLHYIYARRLNNKIISLKKIALPTVVLVGIVIIFYMFMNWWIIRWCVAFGSVVVLALKEKEFLMSLIGRRRNA